MLAPCLRNARPESLRDSLYLSQFFLRILSGAQLDEYFSVGIVSDGRIVNKYTWERKRKLTKKIE